VKTVFVILLLVAVGQADQLTPYGKRVFRSVNGVWRLATSESNGKLVYELKDLKGVVRGKGTLDHLPIDAAVFPDGTGFVLWGRAMREGRGIYAARYAPSGQRIWGAEFRKIFDEVERKALPRTLSFVFAAERCWINPKKGEFVCAATNGTIKIFRMRDGVFRPGGNAAIQDALKLVPPPVDAVRTAALRIPDLAKPELGRIARDTNQKLGTRVAAAVALPPDQAREILTEAVVGKVTPRAAVNQLIKMRDHKALIYLLSHGDVDDDIKRIAANALSKVKGDQLVAPLLREFNDADLGTASLILDVLIMVDGKNLPRRMQQHQTKLIDLLGRKGADLPWLAKCFTQYPTTEAARPLLAAAKKNRRYQRNVFPALRACTGLKIGDDLSAWQKALR
jgi:hypothetical protein